MNQRLVGFMVATLICQMARPVSAKEATSPLADLVTQYSKSAAAKLLRSDSSRLATITASISAAWDIKFSPPPDEPQLPANLLSPQMGRCEALN